MALPIRVSNASASARVSRKDPGVCQEKVSAVPLSGNRRSAKWKTYRHCTSSSKSKPRSAFCSCPSRVLPQRVCLTQLKSRCHSAQVHETARNCSAPPEVFCCVSLHGIPTSAAQLHNVKQTNTCLSLAENPLICTCFSLMSLHE